MKNAKKAARAQKMRALTEQIRLIHEQIETQRKVHDLPSTVTWLSQCWILLSLSLSLSLSLVGSQEASAGIGRKWADPTAAAGGRGQAECSAAIDGWG